MTKTIAFANHKGGVGKTTATINTGAALARKGYNTLLVDLDAQANLTSSLIDEESTGERTIYNALKERRGLPVIPIADNLSIVPSSFSLAGIELEIAQERGREYILKELLCDISQRYDAVLLDLPPSLGLVPINAFAAADDIVVPLTAEALPLKGLTMLENLLTSVRNTINPSIEVTGVLLTRWEGRKVNRMIEGSLRQLYGEKVFSTRIRTNIAITEATLMRQDIFTYDSQSNGAKDFNALAEEMIQRYYIGNICNTENMDILK